MWSVEVEQNMQNRFHLKEWEEWELWMNQTETAHNDNFIGFEPSDITISQDKKLSIASTFMKLKRRDDARTRVWTTDSHRPIY